MTASAHLLLLDDAVELDELSAPRQIHLDGVIGLFWMAPSSRRLLENVFDAPSFSLAEIVEGDLAWGESASHAVDEFVLKGSVHNGIPRRTYLREPLYREALVPTLLDDLARWCERFRRSCNARNLIVHGNLATSDAGYFRRSLDRFPAVSFRPTSAGAGATRKPDSSRRVKVRLGRRLREARASGCWRLQGIEALESLDRTFRRRAWLGSRLTIPRVKSGGATLFSSYENNSRILAPFASELPLPATWVLVNESSRRGAISLEPSRHWLWRFAPSRRSLNDLMQLAKDPGDDQELLPSSPTLRSWKEVESPMLAVLTACWERYLDLARPKLVVTANQWGIEGFLTQVAQRRGIPVLQIVHGILGGYLYTQTPIVSNALVVWGDFWRGLWPEEERHKITSFNAPGWIEPIERTAPTSTVRLTFFSWPLAQLRFYNPSEFLDPVVDLLQRLVTTKRCSLRVRCHPLEDPGELKARWQRRHGRFPDEVEITKGGPLEEDLAATDLALMLRSTVLLNCLASAIPTVIPGWIDFAWSSALPNLPGLKVAADFEDLASTLELWLESLPAVDSAASEFLVQPPGARRRPFREAIDRLLETRQSLGGARP